MCYSWCSSHSHVGDFQTPRELTRPGGYGHQAANFGMYPYGASLQQPVFYSTSKFCNDADQLTEYFPNQMNDVANHPSDGHYHTPFILMLDRGDCLFTNKVRHAQRAGAAAVLIADDRCVCSHDECTGGDTKGCEAAPPTIMNDGSGGDISIPSFILYKEDADAIKQVVIRGESVIVSMGFQVPAPDARIEYDLWSSPIDKFAHDNLWSSLRTIALALGDHAYFTPHMSFYDGFQQGCTYDDNCATMCTNHGRYCSFDPDNSFYDGVAGADLVAESLRRICIWRMYGQDDGIGKEWFDYMHTFSSTCYKNGSLDRYTDKSCTSQAMKKCGIDPDAIDACMHDSGGLDDDAPNSLLDQALAIQRESGTVLIPSVWVNRVPVQGSLSFVELFSAICSGFVEGSEPEICNACDACPQHIEQCMQDGGHCGESNDQSAKMTCSLLAGCFGGIIIFFLGTSFVYRQREKRLMRDKVRMIMVRAR